MKIYTKIGEKYPLPQEGQTIRWRQICEDTLVFGTPDSEGDWFALAKNYAKMNGPSEAGVWCSWKGWLETVELEIPDNKEQKNTELTEKDLKLLRKLVNSFMREALRKDKALAQELADVWYKLDAAIED